MKLKHVTFPYLMWMIIFAVVPLILVMIFAFTDSTGNFTYENLLKVGKFSSVFLKSINLGLISTIICLLIGYPTAYFMSKISKNKQNIMITLLMTPLCLNFLLKTYAWMSLLENNGIINGILQSLRLPKLNIINTPTAIVIGMVYNYLPYMIIPIYNLLSKIDKNLIQAAEDLGANTINIFLKIIVPLSVPAVISGITMVFVPAVSTFIISKMLGGGADILVGDLIEMQFLGSTYNPHLGSAISLILMLIIMLCLGILNKFDKNNDENQILI